MIYIDALNVAQTVEKVREFRRIIPAVDEASLEFLDDSLGICHAYVPCMEMEDEYFLLRLLCETDGLFISKDRFAYLSDELLITAGLRDHVWLEACRLDYVNGVIELQHVLDSVGEQERLRRENEEEKKQL
jgi:hypothetical protein